MQVTAYFIVVQQTWNRAKGKFFESRSEIFSLLLFYYYGFGRTRIAFSDDVFCMCILVV